MNKNKRKKQKKNCDKRILKDKSNIENSLTPKGNVRYQDSFFRKLFKEPKYRKSLYLFLHQEDKNVEDSEFENIELDNILNIDIYNDICFTVRNRLIILVEHQSTLNENMPIRILLYLAEEYKRLLLRSEFSSALYAAPLVKIPKPEFYIVYTGTDPCASVLKLSDAFLDCPSGDINADSSIELTIPVLTAAEAKGILAEYFDIMNFIKAEASLNGSLETAVKDAIIKYQSGYEISDFIKNQKGVYDILFEQISREELLRRQLEANEKVLTQRVTEQVTQQVTEQVTQQVTEQVTQQVTQQVTEQVTQQVTEQVTQQVKKDSIIISYNILIEAGFQPENARQSIIRNYNLSEKEAQAILD